MIDEAVKILKKGGAVVYPTDTAYGLGVAANKPAAIEKLFKIKKRDKKNAVSIIVGGLKQAKEIAVFDKKATKLWRHFLPGALTLVLELQPRLKGRKNWRLLSGNSGTIGLRMPDNKEALKMIRKLRLPVTTTSANISGQPTCYSAEEAVRQFKGKKHQPDFYLDGGRLKKGRISTVVDCTGDEVKILREGAIKTKRILEAVK